MKNPFSKTPFLLLLIPLIGGILLQYYFNIISWSIILSLLGTGIILFSYFLPSGQEFRLRWLFGAGIFCLFFAIGMVSTSFWQEKVEFDSYDEKTIYRGIVIDMPQQKPKTIAYKVRLPDSDKLVVCYLQADSSKAELKPGDEFIFEGVIQPFRNMGNPDDFDYKRYMYNKGYVGSVYVDSRSWIATGQASSSLKVRAQLLRQKILSFYRGLGLDETEYSILSALTLGYQDALSDDLKQSFRSTGTAHVLAVSGLHVGIIYAIISLLLGFIKRNNRIYWVKPGLIILLLWLYAFITGLSPSVVRASIMLTVFCISEIVGRKGYSLNSLFLTAFVMLLYNPFSLFDVGFQLSFSSVLAILYLHPKMVSVLDIKNIPLRYIWQLFSLSLVAQIGTFPLCLYYFGTFPSYFFITNMLIVPLVGLVVYATVGVVVAKLLTYALPSFGYYIFYLPVKALQLLVGLLTGIAEFFEDLPYALISGIYISLTELLLITFLIAAISAYIIQKKPKYLISALGSVIIILGVNLYDNILPKDSRLTIYNRPDMVDVKWNVHGQDYIYKSIEDSVSYKLFDIDGYTLLILSKDELMGKESDQKVKVDWLVLAGDEPFHLKSLTELISFDVVVLSTSLPNNTIRQIVNDSQKLGIHCYDISEKGAYSSNF